MTKTTRRRIAFWSAIGAVVVVALAFALRSQPVPVDLATISRGAMRITLDHEGRTRVRDRYVVSAPVAGRVLRIDLRPGDRVAADRTVIATFLPAASPLLDTRTRAEAQARVSAAEAMAEQARARREQVRVQSRHAVEERERAEGLAKYGLITVEARQAAETEAAAGQRAMDAAEAAVRAAAHELEAARALLIEPGSPGARATSRSALTLRSPIDGVVLERLRESEAVVLQGEPLVTVADAGALEVIADYLSSDAVTIRPGMKALIDEWGGNAPLGAVVRRVEPAGFVKVSALGVEEQRVWVILDIEDPAGAGRALGDGYRVEARVVVWEREDVLQAPASSLFRVGDGWAAFVAENGVARRRDLAIGQRNGASAEVLFGLKAGERVVVYPPDSVSHGTSITARQAG